MCTGHTSPVTTDDCRQSAPGLDHGDTVTTGGPRRPLIRSRMPANTCHGDDNHSDGARAPANRGRSRSRSRWRLGALSRVHIDGFGDRGLVLSATAASCFGMPRIRSWYPATGVWSSAAQRSGAGISVFDPATNQPSCVVERHIRHDDAGVQCTRCRSGQAACTPAWRRTSATAMVPRLTNGFLRNKHK